AGDKVTITAKYTENKNYVVTVVDGLLTINAKPITPTTPTTPAAPTTPETPTTPEVPTTIISEQAVATTVTPVARRTTNTRAAQVVETPEEVVIDEEPVPEVSEPEVIEPVIKEEKADTALTAIEDEDTAKAVLESDCWIHWMILILTALYSAYAIVRAYIRNKRIKELEDNAEEVNA
ncbi:MAG TPA: hypothetical protein VJZ04_10035, partial [Lachnospiraceae bacterium]|nr:hypothetical protein [Lachnospiraceae bacterium]